MDEGLPQSCGNPLVLLSFLKRCAGGIGAAGGVARSYCDLLCRAIGVTIVVDTVLYVTANPLDMLLRDGATFLVRVTIHFYIPPFPEYYYYSQKYCIHTRFV